MYARVTRAIPNATDFDDARAEVQATFLPAAQEQQGYRGFLLLADRDGGELVGISFWETEAEMQASGGVDGYYQERLAHFGQLLVKPATTTSYEVVIRE